MDLQIDYDQWRSPKPDGISACVRVRNEAQYMAAAVRSILPYVDEVVLVTQPSEDDTEVIAANLVQTYDKVRVCHYPLIPGWIDTPGFYENDPNEPGHLVHMSNWALSQCRYSWILKVEGDVLALSRLGEITGYVRVNARNPIYYGLVILNIAGENLDKVSVENPRNGGWDEAIFPNNPDHVRFFRRGKWEVAVPSIPTTCAGWALLHLKRCKRGKTDGWNGEHYIEWTRENVRRVLADYNARNPYPGNDDQLGDECLYEATELTHAR